MANPDYNPWLLAYEYALHPVFGTIYELRLTPEAEKVYKFCHKNGKTNIKVKYIPEE